MKSSKTRQIEKPRKYQEQLFQISKRENVIAVGPTGSGKTHISCMLIKHYLQHSRKDKEDLNIFFVVNRVLLVHQQSQYIQDYLYDCKLRHFKVGKYWGEKYDSDLWKKRTWDAEFYHHQVIVLTAQILLNVLTHGFITMDQIDLLIFDECHHCHKNNPYNRIMKDFYYSWKERGYRVPKIFGMSASPVTISTTKMTKEKMQFEKLMLRIQVSLDSRIIVLGNQSDSGEIELRKYVNDPKVLEQPYCSEFDSNYKRYLVVIEGMLGIYEDLSKFLSSVLHVLFELGSWGCYVFLYDIKAFLCGREKNESGVFSYIRYFTKNYKLDETEKILIVIDELLARLGKHDTKIPSPTQLSNKVNVLIQVLDNYKRKNPNFCALIFVERRNVAYVLAKIIKSIKFLTIRCRYLTGHGRDNAGNSNRANDKKKKMKTERKSDDSSLFTMKSDQQQKLMRYFGKTIDVLVTTSVAEEGIDIQACNLVIRFNIFHDLKSFIQSKGRARKKNSDFIIFHDKSNKDEKSVMENIRNCEKKLIQNCISNKFNRKRIKMIKEDNKGESLTIKSTGAKVTLTTSIQKIAHYCSLLPTDMYTGKLKPDYYFTETQGGIKCTITLPNNSTVNEPITGAICKFKKESKQSAAMKAVKMLYQKGLLNDHLLPYHEENVREVKKEIRQQIREIKKERENLLEYRVLTSSSHLSFNWLNSTKKEQDLYIYAFKNNTTRNFFPFGLIAHSKFPSEIPPIDVHLNKKDRTKTTRLDLTCLGKLKFKKPHIEVCKRFHLFLFSCIIRMNFQKFDRKIYLVIPISPEGKISWDIMTGCITKSPKDQVLQPSDFKKDDILITKYNRRVYSFVCMSTSTPKAKFFLQDYKDFEDYFRKIYPKYFEENQIDTSKKMIKVTNLPIVENILGTGIRRRYNNNHINAMWLLIDHVEKIPLSFKMVRMAKKMSGIFWFIENYLITDDLNRVLRIPLNLNYLKEAVTASSTREKFNYERLEFFGDKILKWITAQDLFFRNPDYHEGILSKKQGILISNRYLHDRNLEKNLQKFVFTEIFTPKLWKPPGYNLSKKKVVLNNKLLSDLIESLLSCAYLSGGIEYAKFFLINLCFPIKFNFFSNYKIIKFSFEDTMYSDYQLNELEKLLDYKFNNRSLLIQSLTHQSYANNEIRCYQRLEFLGDACIDMFVTEYYYHKYNEVSPEKLSDLRGVAVSNELFAYIVVKMNIYKYIIYESSQLEDAIKNFLRILNEYPDKLNYDAPKILGDIFESIAAAIYIDSNYDIEAVKKVYFPILKPYFEKFVLLENVEVHPVRKLCEYFQKYRYNDFKFVMGNTVGEENKFKYTCVFIWNGINMGYAEGDNRKSARKKCSIKVLSIIKKNPHMLRSFNPYSKEQIDNFFYDNDLYEEQCSKLDNKFLIV